MICDHSVRKPLHLCILTLLERLLCMCDVAVIGRNDDVGDLRISKLCSGHTRTGSAQRYNHTCSNDDWFLHDLLLGGSKGPEARGTGGPRLPSQRLRSPTVPSARRGRMELDPFQEWLRTARLCRFLETVPWAATFYHFTKRKAVD